MEGGLGSDSAPSFGKPPLDEVAMGIQFAPLPIRTVDVADFHSLIRGAYPQSVDVQPLQPSFETFGPPAPPSMFPFLPSAPWRTWFISQNDDHVVQLQQDRLLVNWRMRPAVEHYPRFPTVRDRFEKAYGYLETFASNRLQGAMVSINQCELIYFNKIVVPDDCTLGDIGVFLRDVNLNSKRFSDISFHARQTLVDVENVPFARLTVECIPGKEPSGRDVWAFNVTVRGRPKECSFQGALDFFDIAHTEIVTCFDALTNEQMHQVWEKHK